MDNVEDFRDVITCTVRGRVRDAVIKDIKACLEVIITLTC